jgi:beta-galactosidase
MVLRDRNHASIVIWSLCNELGCLSDSPTGHVIASQFKQAIYYADLSRAVTGNIVQRPYLGGRLIDEFGMSLDVAAFSHENENVPAYRLQSGWRSVGLGESGSCFFDRGAYAGRVRFGAGVLECTAADLATLALPYVFGAFSWTLNDYLGETYPTGWPSVSSHFGTFDLAGFAKESAGLYGAVWRACDAARVALANADWTAPVPVGATLDVAAYGCAPSIELFVNGVSAGAQPTAALAGGGAVWRGVVFAPGNVTAVARDAAGRALGAASLLSAGAPASLRLWVESPYRAPRNGSVIAADGADAALLGVSVLDAAGRLCPQAALNVTFTVQGPAAVYGEARQGGRESACAATHESSPFTPPPPSLPSARPQASQTETQMTTRRLRPRPGGSRFMDWRASSS